jgi:hypothetical protein
MDRPIPFRVYFIRGPDWAGLDPTALQAIASAISASPLYGKQPNRFGFTKIKSLTGQWVFGYFTQEFETERHKYDQEKQELPYTDQPFEDSIIILLLDQGIALIQSRRFRDETISMTDVTDHFSSALGTILGGLKLPYYGLDPYLVRYDKAAFIRLFQESQVVNVAVDSLLERSVPEDFVFFNPEVERNQIVRDLMNKEFKSLDQLSAAAPSETAGLQKSKLAKLAITVGEPRELTVRDAKSGGLRTIRRQIGPTHTIEMDVEKVRVDSLRASLMRFFSRDGGKLVKQKRLTQPDFEDDSRDFNSHNG